MSSSKDSPIPSKFLFPLSTNAGYFDSSQEYLNLTDRIKQASLLYENLVFQKGIYICTVWEEGASDMLMPIEDTDDSILAQMRSEHRSVGGDASISMSDPETGKPIYSLSGPVSRRFFCEFQSTLKSLDAEHLPWIDVGYYRLTDSGVKDADRLARSLNVEVPDENQFLKKKVASNFAKDLILSSALQAAASIDGYYSPMLQKNRVAEPAAGFAALQVAIPDLSHLGWEEIVEIRDRDCLVEFRQKMISIENFAREALPEGEFEEVEYQFSLHQEFIQELSRELAELQPSVGGKVGDVALDIMLGFIPIPGVSSAATGLRGAVELKEASQSWTAAFLRLRKPT